MKIIIGIWGLLVLINFIVFGIFQHRLDGINAHLEGRLHAIDSDVAHVIRMQSHAEMAVTRQLFATLASAFVFVLGVGSQLTRKHEVQLLLAMWERIDLLERERANQERSTVARASDEDNVREDWSLQDESKRDER